MRLKKIEYSKKYFVFYLFQKAKPSYFLDALRVKFLFLFWWLEFAANESQKSSISKYYNIYIWVSLNDHL